LLVGIVFAVVFVNAIVGISTATTNETTSLENVEIREYEGQDLSSINDFRENSIKGPQHIDVEDYRLTVTGLVKNEAEYTYDDVISNYQSFNKVVTLHCVEGWSVTILWEGILVEDLLEEAEADPKTTVVIFYAYDGYSTSLPLDYIIDNNIMIAYKMNNVTLPPERGFPFQLVAESKWGYKWIKWITELKLSDNEDYRGYWESRGYPNDADLSDDGYIPEFQSWIILPLILIATLAVIIYRKRFTRKLRQSRFMRARNPERTIDKMRARPCRNTSWCFWSP
jgi:DMSO/TMAO reductase YedYZ molybdopterin-dependent catalytic subunit